MPVGNVATHNLCLSSPPDDINTVQDIMIDVWATAPTVSSVDRLSFETALVELAANVIAHSDTGSGISWTLTVSIWSDRIEAALSDSGRPGEIDLNASDMPHHMEESGRGIPIILALVDELNYERVGLVNQWKISRTLHS